MPRLLLCCFLALFVNPGLLFSAAPEPLIRAHLDIPAGKIAYTGEHVTLVVELLAPGYFSNAPTFELPDPKNMILVPPQGRPLLSSETVNGITYTVQRHELAVFAAHSGSQTIPPIAVRFTYQANPLDKTTLSADLKTSALALNVEAPPGSKQAGYVISARNLAATETWQPDIASAASAKVGDTFTRTVTYTAPDIPGMLFPSFPTVSINGLAIYPKSPEIQDTTNRGTLVGKRRDTITYVCETPGTFTIPAVSITWFDLDTRQLRTTEFPAHTFHVAANPQFGHTGARDAIPGKPSVDIRSAILALIKTPQFYGAAFVLLIIMVFLWRIRPKLLRLLAALRPVHLQSLNPQEKNRQSQKDWTL